MITASLILRLIDYIFGFIEAMLGLRVVLKFFGANSQAPFVRWVYETSQPLLTPFQGMFPSSVLDGGFLIEPSTLFAILVYGLISYGISKLVEFINFHTQRYYNNHSSR